MHFLGGWASSNKRTLVSLDDSVLKTFASFAQVKGRDTEAGGILLGKYRGGHLEVVSATPPGARDIRRRTFFSRATSPHREAALDAWHHSDGFVGYLGEWHTHPEQNPTPSLLDRAEWRKLVHARKDGRPLLVIIVGQLSLHVELVNLRRRHNMSLSPLE